jgi:hypothetical protein
MLRREDQLKILQVFNLAVQPIEPQLVLNEVDLTRLVDTEKAFGTPSTLTPESLLAGLIRHAFARISPRFQNASQPPQYGPPVSSSSDDLTIRLRQKIRRVSPEHCYLLPGERLIGDDLDGTYLTATLGTSSVRFNREELFNAFFTLDLKWTLRDRHFRLVRCLSDAEATVWKSQARARRTQLSLYPSPRDCKKILRFLESYGENFLPYPPDILHPIATAFIDRLNAQCLKLGYSPAEFLQQPPSVFRTHWRLWLGWDYLVEFNYQYQTFARTVRYLTAQLLGCPASDTGDLTTEPLQEALTALSRGLDGVKLGVSRGQNGAFTTYVGFHNGLQQCYALLWETIPRYRSTFKQCALPRCGIAFIPSRKDQVCCSPQHAMRLRAQRAHRKRHPEHAS